MKPRTISVRNESFLLQVDDQDRTDPQPGSPRPDVSRCRGGGIGIRSDVKRRDATQQLERFHLEDSSVLPINLVLIGSLAARARVMAIARRQVIPVSQYD